MPCAVPLHIQQTERVHKRQQRLSASLATSSALACSSLPVFCLLFTATASDKNKVNNNAVAKKCHNKSVWVCSMAFVYVCWAICSAHAISVEIRWKTCDCVNKMTEMSLAGVQGVNDDFIHVAIQNLLNLIIHPIIKFSFNLTR